MFIQKGYGPEVDWWSLGVILFEMIVGYPPFFSDTPTETCKKILNWKSYLKFPPECNISNESKDLIRRLVCDLDKRLGYNGADEIKRHPFFRGIDWSDLKSIRPYFIPDLKHEADTRHFDKYEAEEDFYPHKEKTGKQISKDLCFLDFDYRRRDARRSIDLVEVIQDKDFIPSCLNRMKSNSTKNFESKSKEVILDGMRKSSLVEREDFQVDDNHISNHRSIFSEPEYNNFSQYGIDLIDDNNESFIIDKNLQSYKNSSKKNPNSANDLTNHNGSVVNYEGNAFNESGLSLIVNRENDKLLEHYNQFTPSGVKKGNYKSSFTRKSFDDESYLVRNSTSIKNSKMPFNKINLTKQEPSSTKHSNRKSFLAIKEGKYKEVTNNKLPTSLVSQLNADTNKDPGKNTISKNTLKKVNQFILFV